MLAFQQLIAGFQARVEFPIEVEEVRDWLISHGVQDEITFYPVDIDVGKLRGVVFKYRTHGIPYADARWIMDIGFQKDSNLCWKRLICCKEMMHAWDDQSACVNTANEIEQLCKGLTSGLPTTEDDTALMADHVAVYKALAVLVPMTQIDRMRVNFESGKLTSLKVAETFRVPQNFVNDLFTPQYKRLVSLLNGINPIPQPARA